jgi:ubiquinone/menaquinone biosynthesis C-methylase UbiE
MFVMTCGPEENSLGVTVSKSVKTHWQRVYGEKKPTQVSWYQPVPEKSLQLIRATGIAKDEPIVDAGGGASTLVDNLLKDGYTDISVLDISSKALERSRARLGDSAAAVNWIESDVTEFEPPRQYALWHDRAVFHFLTESFDRDKYVNVVCRALLPGGHFVLATFGPQGPKRCSGLDVQRYGIEDLQELVGDRFDLRSHELDEHQTPMGSAQQFLYSWWQAGT